MSEIGSFSTQTSQAVSEFDRLTQSLQRYTGTIDKVIAATTKFNNANQQFETQVTALTQSGTILQGTVAKVSGEFELLATSSKNVSNAVLNIAKSNDQFNQGIITVGSTVASATKLVDAYTAALNRYGIARVSLNTTPMQGVRSLYTQYGLLGDVKARQFTDIEYVKVGMERLQSAQNKYIDKIKTGQTASEERWLEENKGIRSVLNQYNLLSDSVYKFQETAQRPLQARTDIGTQLQIQTRVGERALRSLANQYNLTEIQAKKFEQTISTQKFVGPTLVPLERSIAQHKIQLQKFEEANKKAVDNSIDSWRFWARFIITRTAQRFMYDLIRNIKQGITDLTALEVKISEIRTISQGKQQLPFEGWMTQVRKLSDTFGVTLEDVVEGAYQTLSNQVAKGTDAITFMNEALRFSRAAVTDTATAVNLGSSVLNAFGLSASSAGESFASMFKLIELGRVRANEISDSFGRVAVAGDQLGIGLDELNTFLALLTIQGKKPNVAMTELRNIFLKLVKPTEAMKKMFESWGVSSGKAAIATYGIIGVIQKLDEEMQKVEAIKLGGASEEIASLFNSIRALSGVLSVTGKHVDDLDETFDKFTNKMEYYAKAQAISVESAGKRMQIQYTQLRNYFVDTLGRDFLAILDALTIKHGGLVKITQKLLTGLGGAIVAYTGYQVALKIFGTLHNYLSGVNNLHTQQIILLEQEIRLAMIRGLTEEAASKRMMVAELQRQAALKTTMKLYTALSVGIGIAMVVASKYLFEYLQNVAKVNIEHRKLTTTGSSFGNDLSVVYAKLNDQTINYYNNLVKINNEQSRLLLQIKATRVTELNTAIEGLEKTFDTLAKRTSVFLDNAIKILQSRIKTIDKAISGMVKRLEDSYNILQKISRGEFNIGIYDRIVESVGNIDDAWLKAKKSLEIYRDYAERGKTEDLMPEIGFKPTDIQKFALQLSNLKEYRDILVDMGQKAYVSGNLDEARNTFAKLLSQADELYKFGYSLNEILQIRVLIQEKQAKFEEDLVKKEEKKLEQALKLKAQEELRLKILERERVKLRELKPTAENIDVISEQIKKIYNQVLATISEAVSPEVKAQFDLLLSDQATIQQTVSLTSAIDSIKTDKIESIETLKNTLSEQLATLVNLEKTRQMRADIEARIGDVARRTEELNKLIEETKQSKLKITQELETLAGTLRTSFEDVIGKLGKVVIENTNKSREIEITEASWAQNPSLQNLERQKFIPEEELKRISGIITNLLAANLKNINRESIGVAKSELQNLLDVVKNKEAYVDLQKEIGTVLEYLDSLERVTRKQQDLTDTDNNLKNEIEKVKNITEEWTAVLSGGSETITVYIDKMKEAEETAKTIFDFIEKGVVKFFGLKPTVPVLEPLGLPSAEMPSLDVDDSLINEIEEGNEEIVRNLQAIRTNTDVMSQSEKDRRAALLRMSAEQEINRIRPIKLGTGLDDPFSNFKLQRTENIFIDFVSKFENAILNGTHMLDRYGEIIPQKYEEIYKRQARVPLNKLPNYFGSGYYDRRYNPTNEFRTTGVQRGWDAPIRSEWSEVNLNITIKPENLASTVVVEIEKGAVRGRNNVTVNRGSKNPH